LFLDGSSGSTAHPRILIMAAYPRVLFGWRLSPYIRKPEHVPDVLTTIFGRQPQPTSREIVIALDASATNYGTARRRRPAIKAPAAELKQLVSFGRPFLNIWKKIEPLLEPEIITRAMILMTPPHERRHRDYEVPTNPGPALNNLLPVLKWLSDANNYTAASLQPENSHKTHKTLERAFLWEPLLQLMKERGVKPGQYGDFSHGIRLLHLALGIEPPNEVGVRRTVYDLMGKGSKKRPALSEQQKYPNA